MKVSKISAKAYYGTGAALMTAGTIGEVASANSTEIFANYCSTAALVGGAALFLRGLYMSAQQRQ